MNKLVYDVFIGEKALGNPCGVVELNEWPSDSELLTITREIAQPVTSFVVQANQQFFIRWFSQQSEINLCGHGSLGAGAALLDKYQLESLTFGSKHGEVTISRRGDLYSIVLPSWQGSPVRIPDEISCLMDDAVDAYVTRDLVVVLANEEAVVKFRPDFAKIRQITQYHALIVTAQNGENSYALRYFAPGIGIDEDRATGSAQCSLAPYWFDKLGVNSLSVNQLSDSGGYFKVEKHSDSFIKVFAQVKARTNSHS